MTTEQRDQPGRSSSPDATIGGTTERAKDIAGTAGEQAKEVAGTAGGQAKEVAGEAKQQAQQVATEVTDRARALVGQTQSELRDQAQVRTQHVAEGLRTLDRQLQALRQGRVEESGPLAGYVDQTRSRLNHIVDRLDRDGFDGVLSDVSGFARRRPGVFLLSCAGAGFLLARLARSQAGATQGNGEPPSASLSDGSRSALPPPDLGFVGVDPDAVVSAPIEAQASR